MAVVQLAEFKRAIKAQETLGIHDLRENRQIIALERSADELDLAERSAEREFAILGLNRRSEVLRNIQAALRRIENGTFGTCTNCEETIGRNRLAAVPWTPFALPAKRPWIAAMLGRLGKTGLRSVGWEAAAARFSTMSSR
jgi:DnaK suppressor protein